MGRMVSPMLPDEPVGGYPMVPRRCGLFRFLLFLTYVPSLSREGLGRYREDEVGTKEIFGTRVLETLSNFLCLRSTLVTEYGY